MVRSQVIQSFVARIWLEQNDDGAPRWRGHVQHIQGPEELYFENLTEMSDFLEQASGIACLGFVPDRENVVSIKKRSAVKKQKNPDG